MDKSLFIYILLGIGFLYVVTNFVGDIQKEDEVYQNSEYKQVHQYEQYDSVDSIGQRILNLVDADAKTQIDAWNSSTLKQEYMELFPDLDAMKIFVKARIRGEALQKKLIANINTVESQFFAGTLNSEQAKHKLSLLK
jgi:hypothetical protein